MEKQRSEMEKWRKSEEGFVDEASATTGLKGED